jgi:hypothetical protein
MASNSNKRNRYQKRLCIEIGPKVFKLLLKFYRISAFFSRIFWNSEDSLCNEMKDYLEHTYNIVSTSFDRHLYLKQDAIEEKMRKAEGDSKKPSKTNDLRQLMRQKNSIKGI